MIDHETDLYKEDFEGTLLLIYACILGSAGIIALLIAL